MKKPIRLSLIYANRDLKMPSTNNFIRKEILDNIPSAPGLQQPTRVASSALAAIVAVLTALAMLTAETRS